MIRRPRAGANGSLRTFRSLSFSLRAAARKCGRLFCCAESAGEPDEERDEHGTPRKNGRSVKPRRGMSRGFGGRGDKLRTKLSAEGARGKMGGSRDKGTRGQGDKGTRGGILGMTEFGVMI